MKENKYHVSCVQETYCSKSCANKFNRGWSGDIFSSFSNSAHSSGVSTLLSKDIKYNIISHHSDDNGRLLLLNLEIDKQEFTIVNVYAPNEIQDRISFLGHMKSAIDTHAVNKNRLIIAGDFNCVLSENDRITRKIDKSTNILEHTIVQLNVTDIWRFLNPNTTEFTYIDPSCNLRNNRH